MRHWANRDATRCTDCCPRVAHPWTPGFVTFVQRYQRDFDPAASEPQLRPFLMQLLFIRGERPETSIFRTDNYVRVVANVFGRHRLSVFGRQCLDELLKDDESVLPLVFPSDATGFQQDCVQLSSQMAASVQYIFAQLDAVKERMLSQGQVEDAREWLRAGLRLVTSEAMCGPDNKQRLLVPRQ
eukprot:gnl/Ergobibamus_cyprinoides/182.p2 GENE.gnl/Ergobibamus_cyprinoides/182~~gnl/Ergobibamus_cyprinoides/182.p2  ORF type:complete len:184 (-),score=8.56 gnl/Ergobibamus_cyprinoides/182:24-575(-)